MKKPICQVQNYVCIILFLFFIPNFLNNIITSFGTSHVVIIGFLDKDSPAATSGVQIGETIIELDSVSIKRSQDYINSFNKKFVNDFVNVLTDKSSTSIKLDVDPVLYRPRLGFIVKEVFTYSNKYFHFLKVFIDFLSGLFIFCIGLVTIYFLKNALIHHEFIVINSLNIADIASTKLFLFFGGVEANPIAYFLMKNLSFNVVIVIKLIIVALLMVALNHLACCLTVRKYRVLNKYLFKHRILHKLIILLFVIVIFHNLSKS